MELRQYWSIIRRRWWLPVAVTLVALLPCEHGAQIFD